MKIADLIERVESLTGSDRALDAELHVALFEPKKHPDDLRYFRVPHVSMDHMDMCAPGTYWLKERSGQSLRTAPHYTADFAPERLVTLLRAVDQSQALAKIAGGFWSKGAVDALITGDWHPATREAQAIARDALVNGPPQADRNHGSGQ